MLFIVLSSTAKQYVKVHLGHRSESLSMPGSRQLAENMSAIQQLFDICPLPNVIFEYLTHVNFLTER